MPRIILYLYLAASAANVISHIIPSQDLNDYTKPLLMPLLLFYVYRSSIGKTSLRILLLSVALLFSWFGDLVLMQKSSDLYFMAGIGLFLLAQITYILVLKKSNYQQPRLDGKKLAPFVVYTGLLFYFLLPAGDFTLPILVYGLVIMVMAIMARLREGNTSQDSFRLAFLGSVLFVLSDSVLAINAFGSPIPYSGVWIMSTYCAAQYFLVMGLLKHVD